MANPSLKAQIEAAKSALAIGTSSSLETAEPNQIKNEPTTEETYQEALPQAGSHTSTPNSEKSTDRKTFELGVAEIDARITSLEKKLLANQQDLHELLTKIRKITNLQGDIKQKSGASKGINVVLGFSRYLNSITISLFILACLVSSIVYFLPTEQNLLHLQSWLQKLIAVTSGWIG